MKKILLALAGFFISFSLFTPVNAECSLEGGLGDSLESCFSETKLVKSSDLKVDGDGFVDKINGWRSGLSLFFIVCGVFGLVYAGFLMVTSSGSDDSIKKAKNIIKWDMIGVLTLIFITTILTFVINLLYKLG